ncbi:MAG: PepSY-associated TM helix domain-containing protein, partial [Cyclobacteriaceae bacterium]
RLNIVTHRDLGYFFSSLIVVYCLSGIALNHINDWNPDFIITKDSVSIDKAYSRADISDETIQELSRLAGHDSFKVYDFPTHDQVKIYYDNASLHVYFNDRVAIYESVSRRPVFYQSNILHRNNIKGWRWFSDIFAVILILINVTGVFILRGRHGILGRGKWLIAAGALPPIIALVLSEFI